MQRFWVAVALFFLASFSYADAQAINKQAQKASVSKRNVTKYTKKHTTRRHRKAYKRQKAKHSLRPSWRKMWPRSRRRQIHRKKMRRKHRRAKRRRAKRYFKRRRASRHNRRRFHKSKKRHRRRVARLFTTQSSPRAKLLRRRLLAQAQVLKVKLPKSLPLREDRNYPIKQLSEVLQLVKKSNLDLRILRQRVIQVELARAKTWAVLKPQLSLGATYIRSDHLVSIGGAVITPQNQLVAGLKLQWAFLNLSAIPLLQMSYLSLKQINHTVKQVKADILYGTARAYYGVLIADGLMNIAKQTWDNAQEHLRISKARLKAGVTPELVVTRALLDVAKAWQSRTQAENGLRNARLALALLVNQTSFQIRTARPTTPTLPSGQLRDWRKQALINRNEVKAARVAVQIARKSIMQRWMKFLPTVAAVGQVQGTNAGGFANRNFSWSLTVAAQMNLYSGGARYLEVKEGYSKLLQAQLELAKAIRQIDNELSQVTVTINNAKIASQIANKQLRLAKRTYQLTQARYKTGVATPVEVSDTLTALQAARVAVLREEFTYELAVLQLQRTLGLFRP